MSNQDVFPVSDYNIFYWKCISFQAKLFIGFSHLRREKLTHFESELRAKNTKWEIWELRRKDGGNIRF